MNVYLLCTLNYWKIGRGGIGRSTKDEPQFHKCSKVNQTGSFLAYGSIKVLTKCTSYSASLKLLGFSSIFWSDHFIFGVSEILLYHNDFLQLLLLAEIAFYLPVLLQLVVAASEWSKNVTCFGCRLHGSWSVWLYTSEFMALMGRYGSPILHLSFLTF